MKTQDYIGKLLPDDQERDAIHIAVAPVIATMKLAPGQDIGFVENGDEQKVGTVKKPIGIVDPYLKGLVFPGQKFFMFLYPNTITSLLHHWTHPGFGREKIQAIKENKAETWLQDFANRWRFDYQELISAASAPATDEWDHFATANGVDLHSASELGEDRDLFWQHLEALTGRKFDANHRDKFGWSCSC